jgi:hypothetical protein
VVIKKAVKKKKKLQIAIIEPGIKNNFLWHSLRQEQDETEGTNQ